MIFFYLVCIYNQPLYTRTNEQPMSKSAISRRGGTMAVWLILLLVVVFLVVVFARHRGTEGGGAGSIEGFSATKNLSISAIVFTVCLICALVFSYFSIFNNNDFVLISLFFGFIFLVVLIGIVLAISIMTLKNG